MIKALLLTLLLASSPFAPVSKVEAGEARGTTGAQFLKIAPGARAAGMAGAFGGLADDVEALYYNPGGLGHLRRGQATGAHESRFAGLRYEFVGAAVPVLAGSKARLDKSSRGVIGVAAYSLSAGDIERRGLVETDEPSGLFSAEDLAVAVSYGIRPFGGRLGLGATAKAVSSRVDSARGTTYAGDAGLLYRGDVWTAGAGVRSAGKGLTLGSATDPLPSEVFAGGSYQATPRLLAAFEAEGSRDTGVNGALGLEYRYVFSAKLAGCLRGGYTSKQRDAGSLAGAAAGLGLTVGPADFDFAFQPFGDLGASYKYSLKVRF